MYVSIFSKHLQGLGVSTLGSNASTWMTSQRSSPLYSTAINPKWLTLSIVSWVQNKMALLLYTFALSPFSFSLSYFSSMSIWSSFGPSSSIHHDPSCSNTWLGPPYLIQPLSTRLVLGFYQLVKTKLGTFTQGVQRLNSAVLLMGFKFEDFMSNRESIGSFILNLLHCGRWRRPRLWQRRSTTAKGTGCSCNGLMYNFYFFPRYPVRGLVVRV